MERHPEAPLQAIRQPAIHHQVKRHPDTHRIHHTVLHQVILVVRHHHTGHHRHMVHHQATIHLLATTARPRTVADLLGQITENPSGPCLHQITTSRQGMILTPRIMPETHTPRRMPETHMPGLLMEAPLMVPLMVPLMLARRLLQVVTLIISGTAAEMAGMREVAEVLQLATTGMPLPMPMGDHRTPTRRVQTHTMPHMLLHPAMPVGVVVGMTRGTAHIKPARND